MLPNIVNEIINSLREYMLYAKIGGSSCFKSINNKHDYDIIIVSKDNETKMKCMSLFRKNYDVLDLALNRHIDIHFISKDMEDLHLLQNPFYKYLLKDSLLTDYEVNDIDINYILERRNQTISNLKERILSNELMETDKRYERKIWYRTYLTLCIYKNKSFELTEEQIKNINILHDRNEKDIEIRTKLIDDMIKEIETWQN